MAFDRFSATGGPEGGSILLVGDDEAARSGFADLFRSQGYDIRQTDEAGAATPDVRSGVDLVIYDERRSAGRAFGFCRASAVEGGAPVILLSENLDTMSQIVALEVGADEVLAAPIDGRLLLARVRALLRRARATHHRAPGTGRWSIDGAARIAIAPGGGAVELARHQVRLMQIFLDHPGEVVTPEMIARLDPTMRMEPAAFRTAISRLRRRLDRAGGPEFIRIVRGSGYVHSPASA